MSRLISPLYLFKPLEVPREAKVEMRLSLSPSQPMYAVPTSSRILSLPSIPSFYVMIPHPSLPGLMAPYCTLPACLHAKGEYLSQSKQIKSSAR